jgi:hypothetical protein
MICNMRMTRVIVNMRMKRAKKDPAAAELARRRWDKMSEEERKAYGQKLLAAKRKKRQERIEQFNRRLAKKGDE